MPLSKPLQVVCLFSALPLILGAQDSGASQAEIISALLARIDKLEKRVSELETKSAPPAAAQDAVPAQELTAAVPEPAHDHGMPEASTSPRLRMTGFSDMNFSATGAPGSRSGFNEGQFILHLSSALSQRVSYFGEISFIARQDAGLGAPPAPGFNVEIERSIIRFDQSDKLKLSFGRYHTPINYWNTAYHHGTWLQTTISRPELAQFGGSFLPVHFVGALAEGSLPSGGLNFNYNIGIGNGRSSAIARGGDFGDVNNNKAWLVNLFAKPDRIYGLQFGGAFYKDRITNASGDFKELITSGHLIYQRQNLELMSEVSNVRHENALTRGIANSIAYYAQTAYRIPGLEKNWQPYYRFEYMHIPRSETLFRLIPGHNTSTIGLRHDVSSFAAIKLEYRSIGRAGQPRFNGAFAQTSFVF